MEMKKTSSDTQLLVEKLKNGVSLSDLTPSSLPSLPACLNEFMGKKDISTDVLAGLAVVNRASLYKVFKGEMQLKRDTLLRIARALERDFDETQLLLKCGNCAALSSGRQRDRIIIDGILKNKSIDDINLQLQAENLLNLFGTLSSPT